MKQLAKRFVLLFILLYSIPLTVSATETLIPVGQVVGLELHENRLTIAAFDDIHGRNAREAGLLAGDELLTMNGQAVHTPEDVREALNHTRGMAEITVRREGRKMTFRFAPAITPSGPRLGLYLRQGITGIGTVTWYDPATGTFAALGHGVNGSDGTPVAMTDGFAYAARIHSVRPGRSGTPGQLMGTVTEAEPVGILFKNAPQGLFGRCETGWNGAAIPICDPEDVQTGEATILSTISGSQPREYSVEILKLYSDAREDGRNMLIRITDPALLESTGGIVQGMSGSPIIQDGKLVGAVTHVLVNDPTTGYGIFIENMLDAAA